MILKHIKLDHETYKVGITKIFFKNGVLGNLEEMRDLSIKTTITKFQAIIRGNLSRGIFKQKIEKIQNGQIIARNLQKIHMFKKENNDQGHLWYNLFIQLKPLLEDSIKLMNNKEMNDNLKEINLKLKDAEKLNKNYEVEHQNMTTSLKSLEDKVESNVKIINEKDDMIKTLRQNEKASADKIKSMELSIKELQTENSMLQTEKSRILEDLEGLQSKFNETSLRLHDLQIDYKSVTESYTISKGATDELKLEKENHSKSIDLLKVQQTKLNKLSELNKSLTEELSKVKSENSELSDKVKDISEKNKSINMKHESLADELTKAKSTNDSKLKELNSLLSKHESGSTKDKAEITKLNSSINILESENEELTNKFNKANTEVINLKTKLNETLKQVVSLQNSLDKVNASKSELDELKAQEVKNLEKIKKLTEQLATSQKENELVNNKIKDYSNKIHQLNEQIKKLEVDIKEREKEKENELPLGQQNFEKSVMQDYSNLKLKLNEINANLRTEKFENKKLIEEIGVLKSKLSKSISPYSSPVKSGRRSIAIGEDPTSEGNKFLIKQIEDLKIKLEQEELNSTRAENYAIELQKKLNKVQNTRGLNSSMDFEKKFRESQLRVSELENKFSNLFESVSPGTTPTGTPQKLTKSESFGRTSLINKTLESANQDFVKIYNDIAKTLKTTREELNNSKLEILRLKALLRDSEDELYQIKRDQHKASIENYENELAQSKVKQENLRLRNEDLNKSVELYKKRSEEYYKKLELAESAISISKRHEEAAIKDLESVKNEYKLLKDELRSSEILIKDMNKEKGKLNSELKDKNYEIIKLNDEIKEINDKLLYNRKVYENKEINENLKNEIQHLNNELKFKLDNESKLIKENKKLTIENETLLKQKSNLESEFEIKLDRIDELEVKEDEMTKKLRVLENEKLINERKIANLSKQVTNLKDLINDVTLQRDELLEVKDKLEEDNMILNQNLEERNLELSSTKSDMAILRKHLENQRMESLEIQQELNQSKISTSDDIVNYSNLKKENLVVVQENDALHRINKELKSRVDSLENKLYNDEQIKYWENKLQEMNNKLDNQQSENYKLNKTIYAYEQEIKTHKIRSENDSKLIKKYNDENFDYQNKINHFKTNLDILQTENFEKDMQIRNFERDTAEMKEHNLRLEKEVLELRSKLGV